MNLYYVYITTNLINRKQYIGEHAWNKGLKLKKPHDNI